MSGAPDNGVTRVFGEGSGLSFDGVTGVAGERAEEVKRENILLCPGLRGGLAVRIGLRSRVIRPGAEPAPQSEDAVTWFVGAVDATPPIVSPRNPCVLLW